MKKIHMNGHRYKFTSYLKIPEGGLEVGVPKIRVNNPDKIIKNDFKYNFKSNFKS